MKFLNLKSVGSVALLILSTSAFADADLGGVMKQMAAELGQIASSVSDASKNVATEAACDSLAASIEQAKALTPPKVAALPADQQATQQQAYVDALGKLEDKVTELKADLVAGNNTAATQALADIQQIKMDGHKNFAH